jgi:hypothetical protein
MVELFRSLQADLALVWNSIQNPNTTIHTFCPLVQFKTVLLMYELFSLIKQSAKNSTGWDEKFGLEK